ncbi:hypothetical protein B9Z19DRAFT_1123663 [Tuber borchii]|uniref:Ankyrin repeat-containing domain protein n=1 Tax=Tuber borchii TaxID=42251 RepID=A0A2T6ZY39_TUBBO|nr:hypothetical protein B9Z19DRAFT_1123663 [Tuber borchii]
MVDAGEHQSRFVKLVKLNRCDLDEKSPYCGPLRGLFQSAETGREDVANLLLQRKDVDPNSPDNNVRTPLGWVAIEARVRVLQLLPELKYIRQNIFYRIHNGHMVALTTDVYGSNGTTPIEYFVGKPIASLDNIKRVDGFAVSEEDRKTLRQASQWVDPGRNIRSPTQTRPEGCQTRPDLAGPNQNLGHPNSPNYSKVNFTRDK